MRFFIGWSCIQRVGSNLSEKLSQVGPVWVHTEDEGLLDREVVWSACIYIETECLDLACFSNKNLGPLHVFLEDNEGI